MVTSVRSSVSSLGAASKGLAVSASNIANMRSSAPVDKVEISPVARAAADREAGGDDEYFRPTETVDVPTEDGGVRAVVREKTPSHVESYDPRDPHANEDGLVARPAVELAEEFIDMIKSRDQYLANLAVIRAEDDMVGELLDSRA